MVGKELLCLICLSTLLGTAVKGGGATMKCLTVPHRPVVMVGGDYPKLDVEPDTSGEVSGQIFRLDDRTHGPIDSAWPRQVVGELAIAAVSANQHNLLTPQGSPPGPGRYEFVVTLSSGGRTIYRCEVPFVVIESLEAATTVMIGPDNVLYRNGQPWLPLIVMANSAEGEGGSQAGTDIDFGEFDFVIDHLEGTPFGLMDYSTPIGGYADTLEMADRCLARGIPWGLDVGKVYPWAFGSYLDKYYPGESWTEVARGLVRRLWNHPALTFYYTNDEKDFDYNAELEQMRHLLLNEDPFHPTLHVYYVKQDVIVEQSNTYDMLGPEFYAYQDRQVAGNFEYMVIRRAQMPETAPFWGCLYLQDQRIRTFSYGCIAHGARGLIYYAFHRMRESNEFRDRPEAFETRWRQIVDMGREIESRAPVLLQPLAKNQCTTSADDVALRTVSGPQGMYLLIVNAEEGRTRDITVNVPPEIIAAYDESEEKLDLESKRLRFRLKPYDVYLIRLETVPPLRSADLNNDGVVNFLDFAGFIDGWPEPAPQ